MRGGRLNEKICNVEDASLKQKMTAQAEYSCGRCGAKAHDAGSVCDPVWIADSGTLGE